MGGGGVAGMRPGMAQQGMAQQGMAQQGMGQQGMAMGGGMMGSQLGSGMVGGMGMGAASMGMGSRMGMGGSGAMGGAAPMGQMAVPGMGGASVEPLSRSVFARKVPPNLTLEELVNEVGVYGPIESFRIDPERREAYINFVDGASAAALLEERPTISFPNHALTSASPVELTWGKKKKLGPELHHQILNGATRNLYVGNLPEGVTSDSLMGAFLPAGTIESVRIMRMSGNGYVNFTTVEAAVNAHRHFSRGFSAKEIFPELKLADDSPANRELQISFTTAQQNCRRGGGVAGKGAGGRGAGGGRGGTGTGGGAGVGGVFHPAARGANNSQEFRNLQPSRSIYVGNLPHGCTTRELTDLSAPYGLLESIRFFNLASPYAFLNFVEETEAVAFWQTGQQSQGGSGVFLHGRSLAVNWAKMPPPIDRAIKEKGGTRHLEVGPINHATTESQVADLIKTFGEIESVVLLPERGIAIVTMGAIVEAVTAREAMHGLKMGDNPPWHLDVQYGRPNGKSANAGGGAPSQQLQPPPPMPPPRPPAMPPQQLQHGPPQPPPPSQQHMMMMTHGQPGPGHATRHMAPPPGHGMHMAAPAAPPMLHPPPPPSRTRPE